MGLSASRDRCSTFQNCDQIKCKPFSLRIGSWTLKNQWDTFASNSFHHNLFDRGRWNWDRIMCQTLLRRAPNHCIFHFNRQLMIPAQQLNVHDICVFASVKHIRTTLRNQLGIDDICYQHWKVKSYNLSVLEEFSLIDSRLLNVLNNSIKYSGSQRLASGYFIFDEAYYYYKF